MTSTHATNNPMPRKTMGWRHTMSSAIVNQRQPCAAPIRPGGRDRFMPPLPKSLWERLQSRRADAVAAEAASTETSKKSPHDRWRRECWEGRTTMSWEQGMQDMDAGIVPCAVASGETRAAPPSRRCPVRRYTSELCSARMRPMPAPTFQQIIQTLGQYWGERGCVLLQPLDTEVGAGTFHPATFLHSLGPEPWAAAYVQPSRRPTDGRYGDNPNRLQHYYQFQVVLKPNPDDIVDLYIGSLEALGIDPLVHDLRFVEDNRSER